MPDMFWIRARVSICRHGDQFRLRFVAVHLLSKCVDIMVAANLQLPVFLLFCFLQGASIAPLVHMTLGVYPDIVLTALACTLFVFVSFTLAAMVAKKRSMMYIGGLLGSAVSVLTLSSLLNLFMRSQFLFNIELYLGLFVFAAYIIFDTQQIISRAESGQRRSPALDAQQLFVDIVAVFVRILIILAKNRGEKERERRRRN